jgi:hypothetical protein
MKMLIIKVTRIARSINKTGNRIILFIFMLRMLRIQYSQDKNIIIVKIGEDKQENLVKELYERNLTKETLQIYTFDSE